LKLVDTTVAVDHLRGDPGAVGLLTSLVAAGEELLASEISRFELLVGVRPRERDALEDFFSALDWVPVSGRAGRWRPLCR
jgi:predicted nucleic acid-binding protein